MFKSIAKKISGKNEMTEKQIYAAIKSAEKKLKCVDQLQTYQTVFICQVIIPNFNMKRRKSADSFVKDVICKNYIVKLKKDLEMWQSIYKEI